MAYVLSVWLHILAAAVWIGSMAFFAIVVAPVLRRPEHRAAMVPIVRALGTRFRVLGWTSLAVLVATGAVNLVLRVGWDSATSAAFWRSDFGGTLAHKLVLVAAVVAASAGHDLLFTAPALQRLEQSPASPASERRRLVASWLGRATLVLSVIVALYAVALVRGAAW